MAWCACRHTRLDWTSCRESSLQATGHRGGYSTKMLATAPSVGRVRVVACSCPRRRRSFSRPRPHPHLPHFSPLPPHHPLSTLPTSPPNTPDTPLLIWGSGDPECSATPDHVQILQFCNPTIPQSCISAMSQQCPSIRPSPVRPGQPRMAAGNSHTGSFLQKAVTKQNADECAC